MVSRWPNLEVVNTASLKKCHFQRDRATRLSLCPGSTQTRGWMEQPKSYSPGVPRDITPTDEIGTYRPHAGAASGQKGPHSIVSLSKGSLRREPR